MLKKVQTITTYAHLYEELKLTIQDLASGYTKAKALKYHLLYMSLRTVAINGWIDGLDPDIVRYLALREMASLPNRVVRKMLVDFPFQLLTLDGVDELKVLLEDNLPYLAETIGAELMLELVDDLYNSAGAKFDEVLDALDGAGKASAWKAFLAKLLPFLLRVLGIFFSRKFGV